MNCGTCHTPINYRFPAICPNCGEQQQSVINTAEKAHPQLSSSDNKGFGNPTPKQSAANVTFILVVGLACMFVGAIVTYVLVGLIYLTAYGNEVRNSADCSSGMLVGILSILGGAALGFVGGLKFASKNVAKEP